MFKLWLRRFAVLALTVSIILPSTLSTFAAVLWEGNTLEEIYNPSGQHYTYAPSAIKEGNIEHIWSCHNDEDGIFVDHIYYTQRVDGHIIESRSVLQPSPGNAWDSYHVCDPVVIAGKFNFNDVDYNYAMFYLGNDMDASVHNQIGVAFAKELSSDVWVKYPDPIITYPNDGYWGVGQPSATSIDGQGRILLFYTKGDPLGTAGYRVELNLRDLSNLSIGSPLQLTTEGLLDIDGNPDWLNNFDIVYDPSRDRFIAVREMHPYPINNPNYIGSSLQIVSIPGSAVWGGGGEWKIEGTLNQITTSFSRNHNGSLLRTEYGTLPVSDQVELYFTKSDAGEDLTGRPEFTYAIWKIEGELTDGDLYLETELNHNFKSKYISLSKLSLNLNTHSITLHGQSKLPGKNNWIGYRIYDRQGYLVEAGTAYQDRIDEDGVFTIPIIKPDPLVGKTGRLEVYMLSAKGKQMDSVIGKVEF